MSTLGNANMTLADLAKRKDPSGKTATIVEMLSQTNDIVTDMAWKEGNLPTGHRTTVRTTLPSVGWRQINQGSAVSKSTTAQSDEQAAYLEAWSECDVLLAQISGDVGAFRLSEASPFVESMSQEFAQTLFYGNASTAPEEFNGLATRYAATSGVNGQNIVKGGGSGSVNSSIWLVVWGDSTIHGITPQGTPAGLQHIDKGIVTAETVAGLGTTARRLDVYRDKFTWACGLAVKDWRYAVRICNIDITNLVAKSSAADLFDLMIKAIHRIPNLKAGRAAFYMNRTVHQMLDIQTRDDVQTGGQLKYENVNGMPVMSFRGIPLRTCDVLLETEATIS